jgi:hypothetical protein
LMARPVRHNAEYFYHPASLRNDRRVKAIRARLGLTGYALLVMLLEVLTDADHTRLDTDEMEMELLAGDLGVSVTEIDSLLQIAEKVGFFARTAAGLLHCPQLDEWLAPVFEKRNRTRNATLTLKAGVTATVTPIAVTETQPVKESTVEYSREEINTSSFQSEVGAATAAAPTSEKKIVGDSATQSPAPKASRTRGAGRFVPPLPANILAYMLAQRPHNPTEQVQRVADKCFNYYQSNGWRVGKNPMKDWQAACQTFLADIPKLQPGQMLPATSQAHATSTANSTSYSPRPVNGHKPSGNAGQLARALFTATQSNPDSAGVGAGREMG